MRSVKWLGAAAILAFLVGSPPVQAAPLATRLDLGSPAPNISEVAVRCGRGAHYVRGHRARNGHWIKGRCVWNRHR